VLEAGQPAADAHEDEVEVAEGPGREIPQLVVTFLLFAALLMWIRANRVALTLREEPALRRAAVHRVATGSGGARRGQP